MLKAIGLLCKFEYMYLISHGYLRWAEYYTGKADKHFDDDSWAKYMKKSLYCINECQEIQAQMFELRKKIEDIVY